MPDEWMSLIDATKRLGCSDQTLRNWHRRAGSPARWQRGRRWNVSAVLEWRSKQSGPSHGSNSSPAASTPGQQARKLEAEIRFKEAQADLEELEVAKEMGLVLPRIAAELTLSTMFGDLRRYLQEMESLTHQIPPGEDGHLTPETVKAWLHARNDAYQNGLAERLSTALVSLGPVPDIQGLAESLREYSETKAGLYEDVGGKGD